MDVLKISKRLSYILRHDKEGYNIDDNGWAPCVDIIKALGISYSELENIVKRDDKRRYSFNLNKTKVRANQGHSFNVDLGLKRITPPDILYHGTKKSILGSILSEGLKPMTRMYVHLSLDIDTASSVANRRQGESVILKIDAKKMNSDNYPIYISENGVYLTKLVPSKYISV